MSESLSSLVHDTCELPVDAGFCDPSDRSAISWYYDVDTMSSKPFYYSGCKGNSNRYPTEALAMQECGPRTLPMHIPQRLGGLTNIDQEQEIDPKSVCSLAVSKGSCHSRHTRYFSSNGVCMKFNYSGCKGNANNFPTLDACERACSSKTTETEEPKEEKPKPEEGTTAASVMPENPKSRDPEVACRKVITRRGEGSRNFFPRFYYDGTTQNCYNFTWNGIDQSGNVFLTSDECEQFCYGIKSDTSPVEDNEHIPTSSTPDLTTPGASFDDSVPAACMQPMRTGLCKAMMPR